MKGILILKGGGVLLDGIHAKDAGGMHRVLSPLEMTQYFPDGENPFHIHPITKQPFSEEDGYETRDLMKTIVEELARGLEKDGHPNATNPKELRRTLRKMLNEATRIFNSSQRDKRNMYPKEGVYLDPSDEKTLHPELQGHAYAPEYQEKISQRKPEQIRIRNKQGKLVMYNPSQADHAQHGHMTESGFFGALPIMLGLFKQEFGAEPYHTLASGNHIKPDGMVIHRDAHGNGSRVWKSHYSNQNPFSSRGKDKLHGTHELRSVMGSLHPAWFHPTGGKMFDGSTGESNATMRNRMAYAKVILTNGGRTPASEAEIANFARSPLMQVLHESSVGRSATRSHSKANKLLNDMRQVLGLRRTDDPSLSTNEQHDLEQHFQYNAGNIDVTHYLSNLKTKNHSAARGALQDALYLTTLLENPDLGRRFGRLRGADDGWSAGRAVKTKFMTAHSGNTNYIDSSDITPVAPSRMVQPVVSDDPDARLSDGRRINSPRIPTGNWMIDGPTAGPSGRGQRRTGVLGYSGSQALPPRDPDWDPGTNLDVRTSRDTLVDLMEHLQSADARMDMMVIKSLPTKRRYHLEDPIDCDILCESFSLENRDLHLIQQSVGDWDVVAQRLKVEPYVVKAVKVALRW